MKCRASLLLLMMGVGAQGCAAVGMTLFGIGAGEVVGQSTSYTLDGIAHRTFVDPLDDVWQATLTSFKRMDIIIKSDQTTAEGRKIVALAGDRTIYIELERLTGRTTRMRVTAKQGVFFRDRATAGELVAQTAKALDDLALASPKTK